MAAVADFRFKRMVLPAFVLGVCPGVSCEVPFVRLEMHFDEANVTREPWCSRAFVMIVTVPVDKAVPAFNANCGAPALENGEATSDIAV
ncbi:hypothetical protein WI665_00700, partial [Vibrio cholerae]